MELGCGFGLDAGVLHRDEGLQANVPDPRLGRVRVRVRGRVSVRVRLRVWVRVRVRARVRARVRVRNPDLQGGHVGAMLAQILPRRG